MYSEKIAPQKALQCMCACTQAYTFLYIIMSLNNHLHVSVMQKKLRVFYSYSEHWNEIKSRLKKSTLIWQGVKQNECFAYLYFRSKLHNPVNFITLFQLLIK